MAHKCDRGIAETKNGENGFVFELASETRCDASKAKNKNLEDRLSHSKTKDNKIRELQEQIEGMRLAHAETERELKEENERLDNELDEWRRKCCDIETKFDRIKALGSESFYVREGDEIFQTLQVQMNKTSQELLKVKGENEQLKIERDAEAMTVKVEIHKLKKQLYMANTNLEIERMDTSFTSPRAEYCPPQKKQCCDKEMVTDTLHVSPPKSPNKANRKIKKQLTKCQREVGELKREKEVIVEQLSDLFVFFKEGGNFEETKQKIMQEVTKYAKLTSSKQSQQIALLNENWGRETEELRKTINKFEQESCRLKTNNKNLVGAVENLSKLQEEKDG